MDKTSSTQDQDRECHDRGNECRPGQRERHQDYGSPACFDHVPEIDGISCGNTLVGEKRLLHYTLCRKYVLRARIEMSLSDALAQIRSRSEERRVGKECRCRSV